MYIDNRCQHCNKRTDLLVGNMYTLKLNVNRCDTDILIKIQYLRVETTKYFS